MAVPYKRAARKGPRKADVIEKFYPQLVTLGQSASLESIACEVKEKGSLSLGDIKSVLASFIEAMCASLYNGQSVNIWDFGVLSLSARTEGMDAERDCTVKNIVVVKINFRPPSDVCPNLTSTRASDRIELIDIKAALEGEEAGKDGDRDTVDDLTA